METELHYQTSAALRHSHLWERLREKTLRINPVWDLQNPSYASRKGSIPEAKGEATLTETLSAEVGGAGP